LSATILRINLRAPKNIQLNQYQFEDLKNKLLTEHQEGVFGPCQHQHSAQQIFVEDAVLNMVGVMFYAEGKQLEDDSQELSGAVVVPQRSIALSVRQKRTWTKSN
jgi:hypothetical protein